MSDPAVLRERRWFIVAWTLVLLAKLGLAGVLPLLGDEAFYWWEGRHPDWAYSDLPAATAWLTRISTGLFGHSPFGLRAAFVLAAALAPWLLVRITTRLHGPQAGWRAGWIGLCLPLFAGLGLLAVPDVLLTLATLLCLDALLAVLAEDHAGRGAGSGSDSGPDSNSSGDRRRHSDERRSSTAAWVELAFGLALGAFSHYRFAVLLAAGAVALLAMPSGRRLLLRPGAWSALAVGAIAWLPLLVWNWRNQGAGIGFQFVDRHPWQFDVEGVLFPFIQAGVVSPVLFLLLLWATGRVWRDRSADRQGHSEVLLALLAGILLVGLFVLGFFIDRERLSVHWPLPAFLAMVPLLAGRWSSFGAGLRRVAIVVAVLGQGLMVAWLVVAAVPELRVRLVESKLYPEPFAGWPEIAAATGQALSVMPAETQVVADNFLLGAQLAFALHPRPVTTLTHPHDGKHGRTRQLHAWGMGLDRITTRPALVVADDSLRPPRQRLLGHHDRCRRIGPAPSPTSVSVDAGRKRFFLYRLLSDGPAPTVCMAPAMAYIDAPDRGARVRRDFEVRGWAFKDGAGVAAIDVLIDGVAVSRAEYGAEMPHVSAFWGISTDPAHPHVGFVARVEADRLAPGRHWLALRIHGRDGSVDDLPGQSLWRVQDD